MKNLVIVESPTKAKTIGKFLGKDYTIKSSYGHGRDLPKSKMGIDFEHNFEPQYVVPLKAKPHVTELKKLAAKADAIYFATDSDREGEAISWHLQQLFKLPDKGVKRIVFHEITKKAILDALTHPTNLNIDLVNAQQARRVLARLVGYELSPLLWKKVARGLSAGRVQSVAVRLIVEREREIEAHKPQEYWTIEASLETKDKETFQAKLQAIAGKPVEKFDIANEARAKELLAALDGKEWKIAQVSSKKTSRKPSPPFTTSTLQQESNRKLGFSAKQTMMFGQQLYEGVELGPEGSVGLITYMRPDSVNLAEKFLGEAAAHLASMGKEYAAAAPRRYTTKAKGAQEAHEAIRPTDIARTPESIRAHLAPEQLKLYDLIWLRALASQMPDAVLNQVIIDTAAGNSPPMEGSPKAGVGFNFRASGSTIAFDGFLKLYPDGATETFLPAVKEGDAVNPKEVKPLQHFTEPKARYSEASLVKTLEELGIGRPSTYAT